MQGWCLGGCWCRGGDGRVKLAGAMIFVRDIGAMEAFYRDVIGLAPVEETRHPDWVEFDTGEGRFSFHRIAAHILPGLPPLSGEPRETGSTKLSFAVASVGDEVARLRGLGVRVIERPWGSFDFVDPEGNISGLAGPPSVDAVAPLIAPEPEESEPEPEPEPERAMRGLLDNRIPPLLVMLIFGWLMATIVGLVPEVTFIFPQRGLVAGPIALVGLLLTVFAALQFRGAKTTLDPLHPGASKLVTGGLFRLSRNPIYLGMLVMLAGWAVFLCNPPALLGLWGFVLFVNRFQIAPEERALRARFGEAFEAYAVRTRRWI
ncbi:MAG: protein-S-isoprenylcysteine methyltransferase [Proteobacteria bacterium]|nr:protein-S-isoprenylcysteine methyltransferase [Pseudomonadota bacterium]